MRNEMTKPDTLLLKVAGYFALVTSALSLSRFDTHLESTLIGNPNAHVLNGLSSVALLLVGACLISNFESNKKFILRASVLSIILGAVSALGFKSQNISSAGSGLIHQLMDEIWKPPSLLGGISVALSAGCLYLQIRFESQNRLLSNLFWGFIVCVINGFAMVGLLTGVESFPSVSILSSSCFVVIGIAIVVMAREKLTIDPNDANLFRIILFCILFGRQRMQDKIHSFPPFLRKN